MKIEIDISGRIEETARASVVADSLKNTSLVHAKTKRALQKIYRDLGKPRVFVLELFSVMVTFLIQKDYHTSHIYIIDRDYYGHEERIKSLIIRYGKLIGMRINETQIVFGYVGKNSEAHVNALNAFRNTNNYSFIPEENIKRLLFFPKKKD